MAEVSHSHGNPTLALTNLTGTTASNSGGLTLSLSAAAPVAGGGFAAQGYGTYTQNTGTIQFANSNGITFGLSTNQMTASYDSTQFAGSGFTTATTAGAAMVGTHNSAGLSLGVPAWLTTFAAQTVQPVAASGSNGSFLFSTLQFVTGNGASFYTDATGIRLSYTVPAAQTVQPVAVEGTNGSYNFSTLKFITGNGASFYTDASGVRLSYSVPSVPSQTVESQSMGLSNLATAGGGTGGTSGVASGGEVRYLFVAGSNITLSQSVNGASGTMTLYAPAPGGGDAVRGIAAGASTLTTNTVNFSNANNVSFGWGAAGNSTVLTASASYSAEPNRYGHVSLGGNTAGTNTFAATNNSTLYLNGGANITLSGNGSTITIVGPSPGGGAAPTLDIFANFDLGVGSAQQFAFSNLTARVRSLIVQPLMGNYDVFPGQITANTVYLKCSMSASTATMSSAHTYSVFLGVYTQDVSTLRLLNSVSTSWGSNAGNANLSTVFAGIRWLTIGSAAWSSQPVFTQGHYYWGLMVNTAGQNYNVSAAFAGNTIWGSASATASGTIGVATVASNNTRGMGPWYGVYGTATAALPVAISSTDLAKHTDVAIFNPLILMLRAGPQTF